MSIDTELQNTKLVISNAREATGIEALVAKVVVGMPAQKSRESYGEKLRKFIKSGKPLTRDGVREFVESERERGMGLSSLRLSLAAIRKLVEEADLQGMIEDREIRGIMALRLPSGVQVGKRGNWLSIEGVRKLLAQPDKGKLYGRRDAAMLGLMVGCGLRREEVVTLRWDQVVEIEGRWVIVDLVGKRGKLRSIPVPKWVSEPLQDWCRGHLEARGEEFKGEVGDYYGYGAKLRWEARKLAVVNRRRKAEENCGLVMAGMSSANVWYLVKQYAKRAGIEKLSPHDLRRTLAQLMRKADVDLETIQLTLGHTSIATTAIYLGSKLELGEGLAGVDQVQMEEKGK